MSTELAIRLVIGLVILAALIVWILNRRDEPTWHRTSEWRVANEPELQAPHRPLWMEPASKGINGRRRA
jgi:hypothetical protein